MKITKDGIKYRKLHIETFAQVLSPIFEEKFSDGSFGFRPGRSVIMQSEDARSMLMEGIKG